MSEARMMATMLATILMLMKLMCGVLNLLRLLYHGLIPCFPTLYVYLRCDAKKTRYGMHEGQTAMYDAFGCSL